ncbi:hypothetical protein [Microbacterium sp. NPDC055455]
MNWNAMVTDASNQLRADHGLAQAAAETRAYDRTRMGVSYKQGHRRGWWDAIEWVLAQQLEWDNLTETEAIEELRKGQGSVFWPLFRDDPTVRIDCERDGPVVVTAEGYCPHCGWEVK